MACLRAKLTTPNLARLPYREQILRAQLRAILDSDLSECRHAEWDASPALTEELIGNF